MKNESVANQDIRVGAFGSCTRTAEVSDIDLVLIYRSTVSLDELNKFKLLLQASIAKTFGLPVDFVTLSEREALTNSFVRDEGVILVGDWRTA